MLFLHGFPEFWYEWRNLLEEFGRDHRAVAPDLRGYNLTDKPASVDDYAAKHLVADIRAMFEHFSPGRPGILLAHDWGGAVAWAFAIAHPEYLQKLVIINAPHPAVFARELALNPEQQRASRYMLTFRTPEAEAILSADGYKKLQRMIFGTAAREDVFGPEDRAQYLAAWAQEGALTGGLNYYRASRLAPPAPGTEAEAAVVYQPMAAERMTVRVPTLVVWGEKDQALPTGNLDGLEEYVPDLVVRRIPDGTHWVIHEQPALVCNYIREFIER
ncbi:MAG: alpha/beta hydrolase [Blastocatellales bacterium]|nr:alpha/beta hydrolase [Blastocatellales bacterium]